MTRAETPRRTKLAPPAARKQREVIASHPREAGRLFLKNLGYEPAPGFDTARLTLCFQGMRDRQDHRERLAEPPISEEIRDALVGVKSHAAALNSALGAILSARNGTAARELLWAMPALDLFVGDVAFGRLQFLRDEIGGLAAAAAQTAGKATHPDFRKAPRRTSATGVGQALIELEALFQEAIGSDELAKAPSGWRPSETDVMRCVRIALAHCELRQMRPGAIEKAISRQKAKNEEETRNAAKKADAERASAAADNSPPR